MSGQGFDANSTFLQQNLLPILNGLTGTNNTMNFTGLTGLPSSSSFGLGASMANGTTLGPDFTSIFNQLTGPTSYLLSNFSGVDFDIFPLFGSAFNGTLPSLGLNGTTLSIPSVPSISLPSVLPSISLPSVLPSILPSGVLPSGVLPSDVLPSILPSGVLPSGVLPSSVIPSDVLPSSVLPSDVLPSSVLPSGLPSILPRILTDLPLISSVLNVVSIPAISLPTDIVVTLPTDISVALPTDISVSLSADISVALPTVVPTSVPAVLPSVL